MAPKAKKQEELQHTEQETVITAPEEPVSSIAVEISDLDDLQAPNDVGDEAFVIPDIPEETPSARPHRSGRRNPDPALTSASRNKDSIPQESSQVKTSIGARAAVSAERKATWDLEYEDRSTIAIFMTAMKEKRILEGTIAGVESNASGAYWVLYQGPVTVRIPFGNSLMTVPADLLVNKPNIEIVRRQRQLLTRSIGAKISFTVSSFVAEDADSYYAIGSRTDALSKIRKVYFGSRATSPLEVGDNVVAQIISNGEHAAYLSFDGIDVKAEKRKLSYKFIQDVTSAFHVGEEIRVQIMAIKPAEDPDGIPEVTVSAKPIEKERFKRNLKRIRINGSYIGTVVSTTKKDGPNGEKVVTGLFLDEVGVPAFSSTPILALGNSLYQGDKVSFQALGVTDEGLAHGKIIEIIKPRI